MKLFKTYFFTSFLLITSAYGQNWQKQIITKKADSIYAIYSWEAHDNYHGASGNIILSKTGRFNYSSIRPMNSEEYSEGSYSIKKDTLILNSDLQSENINIKIEYIDTLNIDTSYKRLVLPTNLNGIIMGDAYYQINNDTTLEGIFIPDFPFTSRDRSLLDSMDNLKVKFNNASFGSQWIPIERNQKFVRIVVSTTKDFYYYKPLVLTNYKFILKGKRLIDISGSL